MRNIYAEIRPRSNDGERWDGVDSIAAEKARKVAIVAGCLIA